MTRQPREFVVHFKSILTYCLYLLQEMLRMDNKDKENQIILEFSEEFGEFLIQEIETEFEAFSAAAPRAAAC